MLDYKFAISGMAGAGKSVFLTSLLLQLKLNPSIFSKSDNNKKGFEIKKFQLAKNSQNQIFDLDRYHDSLRHMEWPEKTTDIQEIRFTFDKGNNWFLKNEGVTIIDFPGERFADLKMLTSSSYEEWSDEIIKVYETKEETRKLIHQYFERAQGCEGKEDLICSYKEFLADLCLIYYPLISPSTFRLDLTGKSILKKELEERDFHARFSGLESTEFAPLNKEIRGKFSPEIIKEFSKNYKIYRKDVAVKQFNILKECHGMIYMVDYQNIINSGEFALNANSKIFEHCMEYLRSPGFFSSLTGRITDSLGFERVNSKISNLAIVASKEDLFLPNCREELINYLRKFAISARNLLDIEPEFFKCSSVLSTQESDQDGTIIGRPMTTMNKDKKEREKIHVPELPEKLAENWTDKKIIGVYPEVPKDDNDAPEQEGLGKIFCSLF